MSSKSSSTSPLTLGEKIMHVRKAKGYSQENLAHAIKRNRPFVQRIENGQAQCTDEMLDTIKKFLGIENAPLLDHELEVYRGQLWVVNDLLNATRIPEAQKILDEMAPITDIPFEQDLFLLYKIMELRLHLDDNYAIEEMKKIEALLNNVSNDALFLYHRTKGNLYLHIADYKNAIRHYSKLQSLATDNLKLDATTLYCIGFVYYAIGKFYQAIRYLEQAKNELGNDRTSIILPQIIINLACSYVFTGDYKNAGALFETSLTHAKTVDKSSFRIGAVQSYMAMYYIETKNYEKGLELCEDALKNLNTESDLRKRPINKQSYAITLINKAQCLVKMNKIEEFKAVAEQALSLAEGDEHTTLLFKSLEHMTTLNNSASTDYLENTAIPYFMNHGYSRITALEICTNLEAHYKKKKLKTKALAMAAIIRDIYKGFFIVDEDFEL